jgi:hypothetical protein
MIRFFKTIQPAALFTIPVVCLLLWLPGFFKAQTSLESYDSSFLNGISTLPVIIQTLISFILVSLGALYLNYVTTKHDVIFQHSYLPAFMYVILMSFHKEAIQFHPLLVSNIVIIRVLDKTFSLFKNDSPVSSIFDGSFLLAIATLIYFPAFLFFFLFLYSIYNLRAFNFREMLIALVGFILPFLFLAVFGFWTDTLVSSTHNFFARFSLHHIQEGLKDVRSAIGIAALTGILVLMSLFRMRSNFYRNTIKTRSTQEILFVFFIFSMGGLFFLPDIAFYHFTLFAIPCSIFLAYFFISAKRRVWIYEAAIWMLFAFIVLSYF